MGTINYTITSGSLPIVVQLFSPNGLITTNFHNSFGSYSFNNVTYQNGLYLKFVEVDHPYECYATEPIYYCDDCPEGYESVGTKCIYYEEVDPTFTMPFTIIGKDHPSYTIDGALVFDTWNYNGTGIYTTIPSSNNYWCNPTHDSNTGVMNRCAIWASTMYINQDIEVSFCVDIAVEKTYYIGVGCDNYAKIKLNGTYILEQDVAALQTMLSASSDEVTFKYWYMYPVDLPVGRSILEVYGHNVSSPEAAVGIQIYDATKTDLLNAHSNYDLLGKIKFSSESLVDQDLIYEYTPTYGYHGYSCPAGYALTCDFPPKCMRRVEVECGTPFPTTTTSTTLYPPPTTTTTTSTSTSSTTTTTTTVLGGYKTVFVHYNAL